jgi:hypothetical protein
LEVKLTPEHLVATFYIKLHKFFETVSDTYLEVVLQCHVIEDISICLKNWNFLIVIRGSFPHQLYKKSICYFGTGAGSQTDILLFDNKKIQLDATVRGHLFTAKSLYMFRASQRPSSGVLKTLTATSGIGHNTGSATSFQRGLIRNPDQTTLEGSSYASI